MGGKLTNDGPVLLCYICMIYCNIIISNMPDVQIWNLDFM